MPLEDENIVTESSDHHSLAGDNTFPVIDPASDLSDDSPNQQKSAMSLPDELRYFMDNFKVSQRGMVYLLDLLKRHNVKDCPSSLYELTKEVETKRKMYEVTAGDTGYLLLEDNINFLVEKVFVSSPSLDVELKVNVDGLPLYKSSKTCVWPILVQFVSPDCSYLKPLPVAVKCGKGKPNLEEILQKLANEVKSLIDFPRLVSGVLVSIKKIFFICDAPARAQIMSTKYHSGFNACHICKIRGEYIDGSVSFPYIQNVEYRSDETYREGKENNQVSLSPLLKIANFVSAFPTEYMHSVLLGCVKRLLQYFIKGKKIKDSHAKCPNMTSKR